MAKFLFNFFIVGLLVSRLWSTTIPTQQVVDSNSVFAIELYDQLYLHEDANICISPYGLTNAMAMLYLGARDATKFQMARILHLPLDQKKYFEALQTLNRELLQPNNTTILNIYNHLWVHSNYPIEQNYILSVSNNEKNITPLEFSTNRSAAVKQVNNWVADASEGKIIDFLNSGDISAATKLLMTNVVYFKGSFLRPFIKENTQNALFSDGTDEKNVEMMHQKGEFNFLQDQNFAMIELPYSGKELELALFIILPDDKHGLKDLQKDLSTSFIFDAQNRMQPKNVEIFLPKFSFNYRVSIDELLKKLGLRLPFNQSANFSGINGKTDLYVNKILQQTFINLDENGTEATSATAVVMQPKAAIKEYATFRADHPFLFFIQDKKTSTILFIGRFQKPENRD